MIGYSLLLTVLWCGVSYPVNVELRQPDQSAHAEGCAHADFVCHDLQDRGHWHDESYGTRYVQVGDRPPCRSDDLRNRQGANAGGRKQCGCQCYASYRCQADSAERSRQSRFAGTDGFGLGYGWERADDNSGECDIQKCVGSRSDPDNQSISYGWRLSGYRNRIQVGDLDFQKHHLQLRGRSCNYRSRGEHNRYGGVQSLGRVQRRHSPAAHWHGSNNDAESDVSWNCNLCAADGNGICLSRCSESYASSFRDLCDRSPYWDWHIRSWCGFHEFWGFKFFSPGRCSAYSATNGYIPRSGLRQLCGQGAAQRIRWHRQSDGAKGYDDGEYVNRIAPGRCSANSAEGWYILRKSLRQLFWEDPDRSVFSHGIAHGRRSYSLGFLGYRRCSPGRCSANSAEGCDIRRQDLRELQRQGNVGQNGYGSAHGWRSYYVGFRYVGRPGVYGECYTHHTESHAGSYGWIYSPGLYRDRVVLGWRDNAVGYGIYGRTVYGNGYLYFVPRNAVGQRYDEGLVYRNRSPRYQQGNASRNCDLYPAGVYRNWCVHDWCRDRCRNSAVQYGCLRSFGQPNYSEDYASSFGDFGRSGLYRFGIAHSSEGNPYWHGYQDCTDLCWHGEPDRTQDYILRVSYVQAEIPRHDERNDWCDYRNRLSDLYCTTNRNGCGGDGRSHDCFARYNIGSDRYRCRNAADAESYVSSFGLVNRSVLYGKLLRAGWCSGILGECTDGANPGYRDGEPTDSESNFGRHRFYRNAYLGCFSARNGRSSNNLRDQCTSNSEPDDIPASAFV